jgi:hypothetical protein
MERGVRNGKICMYFVCDFNGKSLKDSRLLYCIVILLTVEGKVVYIIQVRCFIKIIFMHFF